jgi:hypothetical protein
MDKNAMPANLSYVLLVHAGSYKDFTKKIARDFPDLEIKADKQRATHYYVVIVTENGKTEYKKEDIYRLPIMGMREEFSNYLFFKSVKAYNNVLKLMLNGKENNNAPYDLFIEMLTPFEKYKYGKVSQETKSIKYTQKQSGQEVDTTICGAHIFNAKTLNEVFSGYDFQVDDKEIDFVELIKKQKLTVGVVS